MNTAIQNMMNEHQVILKVLASLDEMVKRIASGKPVPREHISRFAFFFKNFADKWHHGKEEERLFKKMVDYGFPREYGPVAVMLGEHEEGRREVKILAEIGGGSGGLTQEEINRVISAATEFIQLLFFHIHKEDNVLYPMAEQSLPQEAMEELNADCQEYEQKAFTDEELKNLRRITDELLNSYPSSVEKLQATLAPISGCSMFGCGH
ncbi:MAG: hemerythrin domain-containing protein [Verrucomicrobiia bacterium]